MTFDEWLDGAEKNGPMPVKTRYFKLAWNAALEEAALLVEEHTDAVHTPDRIRDLKTPL